MPAAWLITVRPAAAANRNTVNSLANSARCAASCAASCAAGASAGSCTTMRATRSRSAAAMPPANTTAARKPIVARSPGRERGAQQRHADHGPERIERHDVAIQEASISHRDLVHRLLQQGEGDAGAQAEQHTV